jgi:hypothetical protein
MNVLKRAALVGVLLFFGAVFAAVPEAQAARRHHGRLSHARQNKVYYFSGRHHGNYVPPPYRFRKKIVPNSSYQPGCVW